MARLGSISAIFGMNSDDCKDITHYKAYIVSTGLFIVCFEQCP